MANEIYAQYHAYLKKIKDLNGATALLHWDNEVNAPKNGSAFRAQQLATLSGIAHELSTGSELKELLDALWEKKEELTAEQLRNVELSRSDYARATKVPTEFVKNMTKARAASFQAWLKARKENDFQIFKEPLKALIALKREEAELKGYEDHPYDALLEEYEKGARVKDLDVLFKDVREQLVAFAKELREKGQATDSAFLSKKYDKDAQWDLGLKLLKQMGYDFDSGRQDVSAHPFTTTFSPTDVRVTTRIDEHNPMSMIGSCIHEGGHALYEQGLLDENYGLPLGSADSLGIHESQSRLWENNVGLSQVYWEANWSELSSTFSEQLEGVSVEHFYKAINQVKPNLIRIEADELHYHLHVLVRYELEKGLMEGSIEVDDLEEMWNAKYKEFLGVDVPSAAKGVLQDVHWSEGLVGYFPTYSLGSFYAAQFFAKASEEIDNLEELIRKGETQPLLNWLREKIHYHGRRYNASELCVEITGEPLNLSYFMDYVRAKYGAIYGL
ncbi:MAG: carboxypeptidase M32 [Saprospiraceae bacterium]|nr:carboxypeptidase M32 [Saprospiraceae bacterium]